MGCSNSCESESDDEVRDRYLPTHPAQNTTRSATAANTVTEVRHQQPRAVHQPTATTSSQAKKKYCCDYSLVSKLYKKMERLLDETFDLTQENNEKIGLGRCCTFIEVPLKKSIYVMIMELSALRK